MLLGKLARLFLRDDVLALTTVSTVASSLSVLLSYAIVRELFAERACAIRAALLLAAFPAFWYYSGSPLSDATGLAAALLTIWLALQSRRLPARLVSAAVAFGIAVSVRPQTAFIAVAPLAVALWRSGRRPALRAAAAGAAALLAVGILPVLIAGGGFEPIVAPLALQWRTIAGARASGAPRPGAAYLARRWLVDVWDAPAYALVISALSVIGALRLALSRRREILRLLLATFVPYLVCAWTFLTPAVAGRYALPYLPLFATLAAAAIPLPRPRLARVATWVVLGALVAWPLALTAPAIALLHRNLSPPEAAAAAIRRETDGRAFAIVFATDLAEHAENLFRGVPKFPADHPPPPEVVGRAALPVWRFGLASYDGRGAAAFWPPLRPFYSVGHGRYVFIPYGQSGSHPPRFERGWYGEEWEVTGIGRAEPFRWMGREGVITFPAHSGPARLDLRLGINIPAFPERPRVALEWNGVVLDEFRAEPERHRWSYRLPASRIRSDGRNELRLTTPPPGSPAATGLGTDRRELGIQAREVRMVPEYH